MGRSSGDMRLCKQLSVCERHQVTPVKPAKTRYRQPLGALIPQALAPVLKERGIATSALLMEWSEIAGPMIGKIASPIEIRWPKRAVEPQSRAARTAKMEKTEKAVLVLAASGSFALEIQMAEARIIEAVNRRLGYAAIGRIEIRQQPAPIPSKKKLPTPDDPALVKRFIEKTDDIADEKLRVALARMGARITQKSGINQG